MKTMRSSILCFVVLLLAGPLLRAQDLSKYRHFTIGMSMTRVLERTGQKMADAKLIHGRPALVQELNWWPPNLPGFPTNRIPSSRFFSPSTWRALQDFL